MPAGETAVQSGPSVAGDGLADDAHLAVVIAENDRRASGRLALKAVTEQRLDPELRGQSSFTNRKKEREPLPYGQFGENLTITGGIETEIHVGDILRCGTALLQVVQPRVPCKKLDVRMECNFAGRFLRSRRVGYYLRVLEPGDVSAGDAIEVVKSDTAAPSIDEFVRVALLDYWDVKGLDKLLAIPDLPSEWRETLTDKRKRAAGAERWFGLREFEVVERRGEADGVASLLLRCTRSRPLPSLGAGQFLGVSIRPSPEQPALRRRYPIASDAGEPSGYRIVVGRPHRVADPPEFKRNVAEDLRVGDTLRAVPPAGLFSVGDLGASPGLLFFSEGVGITAVLSLLRQRAQQYPAIPTRVFHEDQSGATHPFRGELARLTEGSALELRVAYVRPLAGETLGREYQLTGELTADALIPRPPTGTRIFVCGYRRFTKRVEAILGAAGVNRQSVTIERLEGC